jgi:hypothetical protein
LCLHRSDGLVKYTQRMGTLKSFATRTHSARVLGSAFVLSVMGSAAALLEAFKEQNLPTTTEDPAARNSLATLIHFCLCWRSVLVYRFEFTRIVHQSYRLENVLVDSLVTQRLEVIPVKGRFTRSRAAAEDDQFSGTLPCERGRHCGWSVGMRSAMGTNRSATDRRPRCQS